MASPAVSSPLTSTWSRYKAWAQTGRGLKASLDRWRLWTLILAIAGAILVTMGQQLGSLTAATAPWVALAGKIIGLWRRGYCPVNLFCARSSEQRKRAALDPMPFRGGIPQGVHVPLSCGRAPF